MEKYSITVKDSDSSRTMYFLYLNDIVNTHQWEDEVCHEYHKINICVKVDAEIIKRDRRYKIINNGILHFDPFESHYGKPSYTQIAEYFELLIPMQFFSFTGDTDIPARLCNDADLFTMDPQYYHDLLNLLFSLRDKLKNNVTNLYTLRDLVNILEFIETHQIPIKGSPLSQHISNQLLELMNYIDSHFLEISSLEEIANEFNLSATYICRLFRSQLSQTPYKYLTNKKLEYAKTLLSHDISVTQAAMDAGFYGSSVFIQRFKKKYGITPNEYKKLYYSK